MNKTSGWQFEEEQNIYSLKGFSQKLHINNKGGKNTVYSTVSWWTQV